MTNCELPALRSTVTAILGDFWAILGNFQHFVNVFIQGNPVLLAKLHKCKHKLYSARSEDHCYRKNCI